MNITHVIASIEARRGGPSRSSLGLAKGLATLGHQVELLTADNPPHKEQHGNLTIHSFGTGLSKRFSTSAPMRRHLREQSSEIVHHHGLWLRPLHYVHQQANAGSIPYVISPRGMMTKWAWNHHRTKKKFADRFIHPGALHDAAGWHATSEEEADDIRRLGFGQPICVTPNGVEVPSDQQLQIAREFWHKRAPQLQGRRVALFYSRLHSKKRVIELIDLWHQYVSPEWLLLIVGIPDQFTVRQLEAQVFREGGQHQILVFDGTHQPPPYAIADLFVLPSHSENFGLVVAEALAAGVPALVTDTTPWHQLNQSGAGWCVEYGNFDQTLAQALGESDSALKQRGAIGRDWVKRAFTWETIARKLADFYRELHRPHQ